MASADEGSELRVGDCGLANLVCLGGRPPPRVLILVALGRIAPHPEPAGGDGAHAHAPDGNTKLGKEPEIRGLRRPDAAGGGPFLVGAPPAGQPRSRTPQGT